MWLKHLKIDRDRKKMCCSACTTHTHARTHTYSHYDSYSMPIGSVRWTHRAGGAGEGGSRGDREWKELGPKFQRPGFLHKGRVVGCPCGFQQTESETSRR